MNVPLIEIDKFIRDVNEHNISGIMLSISSGIANKKNFQIDITKNNNICIYIHNMNYDVEKLRLAIDIIDNLGSKLKENKKSIAIAKLNNSTISPRKMRLVADLIRGIEVNKALNILHFNGKEASISLGKLLRSAISNWEQKNEGSDISQETLVVRSIEVGGGTMLKRIQPAPQGRAHRIRKRSNHVTIVVDGAK